jgi:hypothetical protein
MGLMFGGRTSGSSMRRDPALEEILRSISGQGGGYQTPGIGDDALRHKLGLINGDPSLGDTQMSPGNAPSIFRPALPDFSQEQARTQLPDSSNQPQPQPGQIDPGVAAMIGQAPVKRKNTGRDILAGALAVLGDAFSPDHRGPGAVDNLAKAWGDRRSTYDQALAQYEGRKRMAALPGMNTREMAAYMADPKAWGSNMSNAATSRFSAATLHPGDQRYLGEGNGVYQAPTRGQLYAKSIGAMPGSEAWNSAVQDQELGANGPTAFGNQQTIQSLRDAQQARMEHMRQQGRLGMEGVRQGNRQAIRGAPTYGDLHRPPRRAGGGAGSRSAPKVPTATGQNGETIYYRGGKWVDQQGRAVQ